MSLFSEHLDRMKYVGWVVALVAIYGIAGTGIYFLGDRFGLNPNEQLALIILILLTFPFVLLINYLWKRRNKSTESTAKEASTIAATNNYEEITSATEVAVQWLRSTKLGEGKLGDVIYNLPWFFVIGLASAGKTSLLNSSSLDFHLLPGQSQADLDNVHPTHSCQWRITNEAVFIDTTGNYQTEEALHEEWLALISTIKNYRRERPIDGLLLVIDGASLIEATDNEIEHLAKTLRTKIDEIIQILEQKFPTYLLFTHADKIEGFADFFHIFNDKEKAQVWGVTIPLEHTQQAYTLFNTEFNYLYEALLQLRLARLTTLAQAQEQINIFNFPLYFNNIREKFRSFISSLFRPNPFSENPLLRGFYFTGRVSSSLPQATTKEVKTLIDKNYFTEDFFTNILLPDSNLAASFQKRKPHPQLLPMLLLSSTVLVCLFLLIGMGVSWVKNRQLVADALERGSRLDEISRSLVTTPKPDEAALRLELETANSLQETLVKLDGYEQSSTDFSLGFGLYSGKDVKSHLRTIYFDSMNRLFFRSTVTNLENDLQKFVTNTSSLEPTATNTTPVANEELGKYYDLLKAYLMLANPEKAEPAFLANQLNEYWKMNIPTDMQLLAQQQLDFYSKQANHSDVPHIKTNEKLVSEARRHLAAYPATDRFFKRVTSEIDTKVAAVTLDAIIQNRGQRWLVGTYSVPGSFTIEGYHNHMSNALASAATEMSKDDWVMGSVALTEQSADINKLQALYYREYIAQWQKFIKGINLRHYKSKDDAVEALKALSGSDSPLVLVLNEVARQTRLSAAPDSGNWITSLFSKKPTTTNEVIKQIEKEFQALHQFTLSENEKEVLLTSQYRAALRSVLDGLEMATADQLAQTSKMILTGKDDIGLQKGELNVSKLLEKFNTAATTDVGVLCKEPLGNLRAMLYGGGYEQIERSWSQQIYPKAHALESGFPFTSNGETPLTDLTRFLNPVNGQFTVFFNDKLASSFEEGQGQLKLKESGAFKFSNDFISYLNNARQLREALFTQGNQQPEVSYEILLQASSGVDIVIEVDGTRVETRGTSPQSAKFIWPAHSGSSGAKITVIQNEQVSEKAFPGEWGLFKMVTAGGLSKSENNQYSLAWNVGTVTVRAVLRPASATNPFQRNLFTQLSAPQTLR